MKAAITASKSNANLTNPKRKQEWFWAGEEAHIQNVYLRQLKRKKKNATAAHSLSIPFA